jgi:G3E family GTPase
VERRIISINPTVSVTRVNHGCVEPGVVFDAGLFAPEARSEQVANWFAAAATGTAAHSHAAHHHAHHTHGSKVTSFSLIVREPIRWTAFSRWLDYVAALKGDDLLRFKALVNVADRPQGPVVVHAVQHVMHPPITMDAWPSDDRSSRLVFIVRDIPAEAIERTLARFGEISRDSITRPAA